MAYVNKGGLNADKLPYFNETKVSQSSFRFTIPASVDWRLKRAVSPIKNQGSCGSCSAFSAIASLESAYAITNRVSPPLLSEQNLVDCTYTKDMCETGGWYFDEWNYIKKNRGIATAQSYPYVSGSNGGHVSIFIYPSHSEIIIKFKLKI